MIDPPEAPDLKDGTDFRGESRQGSVRLLVVYHHLPHYRYDVFRALEATPGLSVSFAAGLEGRSGIATIPPTKLRNVTALHNLWLGNFLWQRGLVSLLVRHPADAVIFLGDTHFVSSFVGAVLCRILGIPVLYWTIGWHRPDTRRTVKWIRRLLLSPANLLLLYGQIGRQFAVASGFPQDRLRVVYNSSSEPMRATSDDPLSLRGKLPSGEIPVLTSVARLTSNRGLDALIEAAAKLRSLGQRVEVLIVGNGPARDSLAALAAQREVSLYLPGSVYDAAGLADIYSRTTLTVVPGWAGLTVLQSLKYGVPVVTHDDFGNQGPEVEAIRPGHTGDFYRNGNADDLTATIERWLQIARRTEIRAACRESVQTRWTAEHQALAISKAVAELVDG